MSHIIPPDFKEDNQLFLDVNDSENTDVFLIRVPKGFDITKLHGTEFSASEIKEIEVEDGTNQLTSVYELGSFSGQGLDVLPLIKSKATSTLGSPLKGFLSINKSYRANPTTSLMSHRVEPTARVAMPEGLKVRFKPFGAGMPFSQSSSCAKKKKRKRKHSVDISASALTQDILHANKKRKTEDEANTFQHKHKKHKKNKK